ncbi:MAG: hypothetical protein JJE47_01100 [Acidimicrobiia bacterium]|nr:hypothetical protein [Acidimicrobiia bacterium]
MSSDRVGWEGWAVAFIAIVATPVGLLFLPILGGFGGTSHSRYPPMDAPPSPINPLRLTVGLVIALVLVVAASWLIRRTDWESPSQ